jgi:hypothetical protein
MERGNDAADGGEGVSRTPEFDFVLPLPRSRGGRGSMNSHGGGVSGSKKRGGGGGGACVNELCPASHRGACLPDFGEWITCSIRPPSEGGGGRGGLIRLEGGEMGEWVDKGDKAKVFARGRRREGGLCVCATVCEGGLCVCATVSEGGLCVCATVCEGGLCLLLYTFMQL